MTKTTGTAQKSTKGSDIRPPREIVENTKARRAWLADKLVEVLAQPDTCQKKTKIVGTGSYQVVSVWKLVTVEGRERFRGVCQLCGHEQVVDAAGVIVLHGYNRPGYGYIVGQCPAAKEQPLNTSDVLTRKYLAQFSAELPAAIENETAADRARVSAIAKRDRVEGSTANYSRPSAPMPHQSEELQREKAARLATWEARHPLTVAAVAATAAWSEARSRRQWLTDMVTHLEGLLAAGILGSPLTREVVA